MTGTLALSGWGQPHDALSIIAPDATHIDYARHASVPAALFDIVSHASEPDLVIGWSLGGQLAVRAIAAGMLRPRQLVLIATPFQFVKTDEHPIGMQADLFAKFRDNYSKNPELTLNKSWELISKDDSNEQEVRAYLSQHNKKKILLENWLYWLDMLAAFSCNELHLEDFPPTLLIHGERDLVVYHEQALEFSKAIPYAKLMSIPACGHAPHWHDPIAVTQAIYA